MAVKVNNKAVEDDHALEPRLSFLEPLSIYKDRLFALVQISRPHHWVKNIFVLAPLLFVGPPNRFLVAKALCAFLSFSFLASGIYCLNDVIDAKSDRLHPRKRFRPVASGRIPAYLAVTLSVMLIFTALLTSFLSMPPQFIWISGLYLVNNLIYFTLLKHRVVVDVLVISIGFVLRILAGCAALGVTPSSWIIICGFSLAMLLGFGKRRLEIEGDKIESGYRPALKSYSEAKLNMMLGITSSICLVSYMLYTVSPQTVQLHGTENLIYTVPLVAYGIFRYLFKVQEGRHDGPVEVLLNDPIFIITGALWVIAVAAILYLPWLK